MKFIAYSAFIFLFLISCNQKADDKPIDFMTDGGEVLIVPQLPIAPRWIEDTEQIISESMRDSINAYCSHIFEKTGHLPMIHTVAQLEPYVNLNEYASAIDAYWADDGQKYFIFLISDKLMEVRIIHGTFTESLLPPDFTDKVLEYDMFPYFRSLNYSQGILEALKTYEEALTK
jgi:uncharacterized membrane protein YgcG